MVKPNYTNGSSRLKAERQARVDGFVDKVKATTDWPAAPKLALEDVKPVSHAEWLQLQHNETVLAFASALHAGQQAEAGTPRMSLGFRVKSSQEAYIPESPPLAGFLVLGDMSIQGTSNPSALLSNRSGSPWTTARRRS